MSDSLAFLMLAVLSSIFSDYNMSDCVSIKRALSDWLINIENKGTILKRTSMTENKWLTKHYTQCFHYIMSDFLLPKHRLCALVGSWRSFCECVKMPFSLPKMAICISLMLKGPSIFIGYLAN